MVGTAGYEASDRMAKGCSPLSTSGTVRGGLRLDSGVSGESSVTGLPVFVCYIAIGSIIGQHIPGKIRTDEVRAGVPLIDLDIALPSFECVFRYEIYECSSADIVRQSVKSSKDQDADTDFYLILDLVCVLRKLINATKKTELKTHNDTGRFLGERCLSGTSGVDLALITRAYTDWLISE